MEIKVIVREAVQLAKKTPLRPLWWKITGGLNNAHRIRYQEKWLPDIYERYTDQPIDQRKVILVERRYGEMSSSLRLLYEDLKRDGSFRVHVHYLQQSELRKLENIAAEMGAVPHIMLRIKPGIDAHTHQFIMTGQIDSKFGFALETGEDPLNNPIEYVLESIKTIYSITHKNGAIRRVNVNIAATTVENYRKLKEAGIGTYILFQETYDKKAYEKTKNTKNAAKMFGVAESTVYRLAAQKRKTGSLLYKRINAVLKLNLTTVCSRL